jgi:hypothetical protein
MAGSTATFIRFVLPHESMDELVREAKHLTWERFCEHALLGLENGRRVLVRGSAYAIELHQSGTSQEVFVVIQDDRFVVKKLIFHTHPKATGPSDDDLKILEILGQSRSMLYEIFGDLDGTEIRPKGKRGQR